MPQYRISNAARADIVDILRLSQTQFGDQARQRHQALILCVLQAIADTPIALAATTAMSLHRAFSAITSSIHASRPNKPMERSKAHGISCSIVWQTTT